MYVHVPKYTKGCYHIGGKLNRWCNIRELIPRVSRKTYTQSLQHNIHIYICEHINSSKDQKNITVCVPHENARDMHIQRTWAYFLILFNSVIVKDERWWCPRASTHNSKKKTVNIFEWSRCVCKCECLSVVLCGYLLCTHCQTVNRQKEHKSNLYRFGFALHYLDCFPFRN